MYSLQKAAAILGTSEATIRNWIKRHGIQKVVVETDRKRVYIADDDMNTLVDHKYQRTPYNHNKLNNAKKLGEDNRNNRGVITVGEVKYYSLANVASLLGVSVTTVKVWSKHDLVEKKQIMTDRKRSYISREDVLRMAELHGRKIPSKVDADTDTQRDVNTIQHDMDELCSIKEVSLYLGISKSTAKRWIKQANIGKTAKSVDRCLLCITYRDVVRLADLHRRLIVPKPPSLTVREEIKEIRDEQAKLAADIEDIKHDLRLLAKRSIYIG